MKARAIRRSAAALAVFGLVAGHAMTGSTAEAQQNPLQGFTWDAIKAYVTQQCENAWHSSPAAATSCNLKNTSSVAFNCVFSASCRGYIYVGYSQHMEKWFDTSWEGPFNDVGQLGNCNGTLKVGATNDCWP